VLDHYALEGKRYTEAAVSTIYLQVLTYVLEFEFGLHSASQLCKPILKEFVNESDFHQARIKLRMPIEKLKLELIFKTYGSKCSNYKA
jgi:hypothetical protein